MTGSGTERSVIPLIGRSEMADFEALESYPLAFVWSISSFC
jgi:hypothetical protein